MQDFEAAFDEISSAMAMASQTAGHTLASQAVERHGLTKRGDGTPSQITIWENSADGRALHFKWRWYDQSQAFSIRPDMNVLTLELHADDKVSRKIEHRYEDTY